MTTNKTILSYKKNEEDISSAAGQQKQKVKKKGTVLNADFFFH